MKRLTPKEEEVMQALWELKKAFIKDIQEKLPEELHYNTVSTMVRKLEDKGFIDHETIGGSHQYFPKITREAYRRFFMKNVSDFLFGNSYKEMVSFFAKEEKISAEELKEILNLIENPKKK